MRRLTFRERVQRWLGIEELLRSNERGVNDLITVLSRIERVLEQHFVHGTNSLAASAAQAERLEVVRLLVGGLCSSTAESLGAIAKDAAVSTEGVARLLLLLEPQAKKLTSPRRPVAQDWDAAQIENLQEFEENPDGIR